MLITGVSSGLGKYLARYFKRNADVELWAREDFKKYAIGTKAGEEASQRFHDVIIHCADDYTSMLNNFQMLHRLTTLPHYLFIFISSIDCYRAIVKDQSPSKLAYEKIVKERACNYLIYRCGALLGMDARPNSFIKMINHQPLTVTADSTFGYVTHNTLTNIILHDKNCKKNETIHVCGNPISMEQLANEYDINPQYGTYKHTTPNIWYNRNIDSMREIKSYMRDRELFLAANDTDADLRIHDDSFTHQIAPPVTETILHPLPSDIVDRAGCGHPRAWQCQCLRQHRDSE